MIRTFLITACVSAALSSPTADAQTIDLYNTHRLVSDDPKTPLLKAASCQSIVLNHPIELQDAILQAVCTNPLARQAWSNARAQAAAVGIAEAAYLPTLDATVGVERDTLSTNYDGSAYGAGNISRSQNSSSKYGMLKLSWVLFDFGKRSAALQQAYELLAAASATQDNVLQMAFFDGAKAFYGVRDAQASLDATRETENVAKESLAEASAKHDAGVGTLSDQLQAKTTWRRAVIERVNAERDLRTATGTLAAAMGLDANAPVRLVASEPEVDNTKFIERVDRLIEEAKIRQPKLVAARARLEAARANVDATRAQSRPTISLVGTVMQNNPSYEQQPQSIPINSSRGSTIGLQVTIPLFDGFASGYRVAQAQAQADAQEADTQNTELQVSLDVWNSYQNLRVDSANLDNSKDLLADAQRALDIARGRYKAGVGTFIELLNAQTALTDAQKQRVLAVSKWRTARLKLASSLGNLGFEAEN